MPSKTTKRGIILLASTSVLALGLAAAPVAVDFDLSQPVFPVIKSALADGGDDGGDDDGHDSDDGGDDDGHDSDDDNEHDGDDDDDNDENDDDENDDDDNDLDEDGDDSVSPSVFGDIDQDGPDLDEEQELDAIATGWQ